MYSPGLEEGMKWLSRSVGPHLVGLCKQWLKKNGICGRRFYCSVSHPVESFGKKGEQDDGATNSHDRSEQEKTKTEDDVAKITNTVWAPN